MAFFAASNARTFSWLQTNLCQIIARHGALVLGIHKGLCPHNSIQRYIRHNMRVYIFQGDKSRLNKFLQSTSFYISSSYPSFIAMVSYAANVISRGSGVDVKAMVCQRYYTIDGKFSQTWLGIFYKHFNHNHIR